MRGKTLGWLCVSAVVLQLFSMAAVVSAQGVRKAETDVAFIPDDAFFAMLVRPRQMLKKYGDKSDAPLALMRKSFLESGGVDIDNLNEFLIVSGFDEDAAPAEDADRPSVDPEKWFSMMMRFEKPPEQARIVENLTRGAELVEHNGKKYYQSQSEHQPSAWFPDERTMVLALDERMKMIMKRGAMGMGSLRHHLRRSDPQSDGVMVLSMDTGKAWFKAVIPPDEVPAVMRPILELPTHLDVAVISGDLAQDEPAKMLALANDEKSAKYLTAVTREFQNTLFAMLEVNREQIVRSAPNERIGQRTVDLFDKVLKGIKLERDGRKIRGTLKAEGGLVVAGALMAEMFADDYRRSERWRRESKLREIGRALRAYVKEHKQYPPAASHAKDGTPLLSWRVHVLPHLPGGKELFDQFHLDEPWNSEHNIKLVGKMPAAFAFDRKEGGKNTQYLAAIGENTVIRAKNSAKPADIKDRQSETIVLVEVSAEHAVPWTKPADFSTAADAITMLTAPNEQSHFLVLTADGDGEHIKKTKITADALQGFFSIAGGEEERIYKYGR